MEVASAPRNAEELYIEVQVVQIIRSDAFSAGDWLIFFCIPLKTKGVAILRICSNAELPF